jgi:hypothetical protein
MTTAFANLHIFTVKNDWLIATTKGIFLVQQEILTSFYPQIDIILDAHSTNPNLFHFR